MYSPANVHAVFSIQTVKFAHVFYVPLRKPLVVFFSLFACFFVRQVFLENVNHLRPKCFGNKKGQALEGQASGWACRIRVQNFRVYLSKPAWTRYVVSFKLLGFSSGSSFFSRFCLMLNIGRSDLRFFAQKNLQTCLGVPPTGSCKMRGIFFSSPLGKNLNTIENIQGLSSVDMSFAPRDSPRPFKRNWPCHPLPLVMGRGGRGAVLSLCMAVVV